MPSTFNRTTAMAGLAVLLAACGTSRQTPAPSAGGIYKVGNPYQIQGTWYYPAEQPDYDETGVASWYGPNFYGRYTANGESYDAEGLTAAHRTLPMPVNVRVTNLENGRALILRVNDRGPFAKGRIIDVSERAAKLLGFHDTGTARVRVTFLSRAYMENGQPPPSETPVQVATAVPAAPAGKVDVGSLSSVPGAPTAPPRPTTSLPSAPPVASSPDVLASTQPTGQVNTVPVPAVTHLYVQVGAFSIFSDARRIQARLGPGLKIYTIERNRQRLYRVRLGPFEQVADADQALARVMALGSNDARIVVDQ